MTLYKKTLLILGAIFLCLLLVLYGTSRAILLKGFSDIEHAKAFDDTTRAFNFLNDEIDSLNSAARDWASNNSSYDFVTTGNTDLITGELRDTLTWKDNNIDAMIFLDSSGRLLYGSAYSMDEMVPVPLPADMASRIDASDVFQRTMNTGSVSGVIGLEEGVMMIASLPVLPEDKSGAPAGCLVWGRFLGDHELNRLQALSQTAITKTDILGSGNSPDVEARLAELEAQSDPIVMTEGNDSIGTYTLIRDIDGAPVMIMRVDTARDVHAQAMATITYVVLTIFAVGLVFVIVTVTLMRKIVISRIEAISSGVRQAAMSGDINGGLVIDGNDEVAVLAGDINELMQELAESSESLAQANRKLAKRVKDNTERLQQKIAVLQAVADIDKEIVAAKNTLTIQGLICERVADLLDVPKVLVVCRNQEGEGHVTSSCGLEIERPHYDEIQHLFSTDLLESLELTPAGAQGFDEVTAYNFYMPQVIARENVHSLAIAPLHADGSRMGALLIFDTKPRRWSEEEIQILGLLASQVALGLNTARLFEDEKTRSEELMSLYDLSRDLSDAPPDIDTILTLISRTAVFTIHVTCCRIAIIEGENLFMRSAYPRRILGEDLQVGISQSLAKLSYCKRVLMQDSPVVLTGDKHTLSQHEYELVFAGGAKTVCLVPLKSGNQTLGIMILGEARDEKREPFSPEKLNLARNICDQTASTLRRAELFAELEQAYMQTVLALANAVDAKDTYTNDHGQKMSSMALAVGRMQNMSPLELDSLHYAALLHDIGKIGVRDSILQKPAPLSDEEWLQMRKHPSIGEQILSPVPHLGDASLFVRHHHEHFDGSGYPDGLVGDTIPLGARILAVIDSYSAMRDKRVYKEPRRHEDCVRELLDCSGTQFDPAVVNSFLRLIDNGIINVDDIANGCSKAKGDTEAA